MEMIEMADEKRDLIQFTGLYMGRVARRDRINKAGAKVITYGVNVKAKESDQFAKSFTCTNNTKGINEIKELDWVRLGYIPDKYINKSGLNVTSHKIMWSGKTEKPIQQTGDSPENDFDKGKASSSQNTPVTANKPDLSKFDEFKVKYLAMLKSANMQPNPVHMVGSFIATNEKERVKELIEKCKEALK